MPTGIVVGKPSCEWKHCNLLLKTALASCLQYGLQLGYVWAGKNSANQPQQACQKPDVAELLLQAKSALTWWSVMLCVWSRGGVVAYAAVWRATRATGNRIKPEHVVDLLWRSIFSRSNLSTPLSPSA